MYHRIGVTNGEDPWNLVVSPDHFAQQLEVLQRHREVIPLRDLARCLSEGKAPPRDAAVITFDDGYADNLLIAKPLLARLGLPATVFVTANAVGREAEFWWDELGRILLSPARLPETLQLETNGISLDWRNTGRRHVAAENATRSWRVGDVPPTPSHALYLAIWEKLKGRENVEIEAVLARLRDWTGVDRVVRPDRRTLTRSELLALADGGGVDVGAHGFSHEGLGSLAPDSLDAEIRGSRSLLEDWLGRSVLCFAYPSGDYDTAAADAVRRAGFICACTSRSGAVRRGADRFRLSRSHVSDWDGDEFERQLGARFVR